MLFERLLITIWVVLVIALATGDESQASVRSDNKESESVRYDKDSYGAPTLYYDKRDAHRSRVEESLNKIDKEIKLLDGDKWENDDRDERD